MLELFISIRSTIIHFLYIYLAKKVFFMLDPEDVHDRIVKTGTLLGKFPITRWVTKVIFTYQNPLLFQKILGISFPNPIGLAAGFDKDAHLTDIISAVGFGFIEVGSITGEKCPGNPRPRLWRLKKSKALTVHYGLKNEGCLKLSKKLKNKSFSIPVGISIAKTNSPKTVNTKSGIADYAKAFNHFAHIGHYFTINLSCPNAYGGQPFTDAIKLDKLLNQIDKIPTSKPIFLKLSPDLSKKELDAILSIIGKHRVHGFVCTNLTKNRNNSKIIEQCPTDQGGISGKVVEDLANKMISYIYKKTKGKYIIIGCGGVFSAEDAYSKIKAGASLVQLITGMIFEGPQLIGEINQGLVRLLKKDGFTNISQVIGKDIA